MTTKLLSCASSNVRSLRGGSVVPTSFANSLGVNILALQETHLYIPSDITHLQINNPGFDFFFDNGTAGAREVAFAVRKHIFDEVTQVSLNFAEVEPGSRPIESGRACAIRICLRDESFYLVCAYAPNSKAQRHHFLKTLSQACLFLPSPLILLGDWNNTLSPLDRFPNTSPPQMTLTPSALSCILLTFLISTANLIQTQDILPTLAHHKTKSGQLQLI